MVRLTLVKRSSWLRLSQAFSSIYPVIRIIENFCSNWNFSNAWMNSCNAKVTTKKRYKSTKLLCATRTQSFQSYWNTRRAEVTASKKAATNFSFQSWKTKRISISFWKPLIRSNFSFPAESISANSNQSPSVSNLTEIVKSWTLAFCRCSPFLVSNAIIMLPWKKPTYWTNWKEKEFLNKFLSISTSRWILRSEPIKTNKSNWMWLA